MSTSTITALSMPTHDFSFEITSHLDADKDVVLAHATSFVGVNKELGPYLKMTAPEPYREKSLFEAPVGVTIFRSIILFFFVIPIDFDKICFESLDPESGFVETSTMLSCRLWRHERRVTATKDGGCDVLDRIAFTARMPGAGFVLLPFMKLIFRHRHAQLRALFNER